MTGRVAMVEAMGGIDIRVAQATSDRGLTFAQGPNHLDGADALVAATYPTDKLADARETRAGTPIDQRLCGLRSCQRSLCFVYVRAGLVVNRVAVLSDLCSEDPPASRPADTGEIS